MDVMWIAAVAVVVLAVFVVAKRAWRPAADETHSVRHYQNALGTMEHFSAPDGLQVPPGPVRARIGFPDRDVPLVFDDSEQSRPNLSDPEEISDGFRSERARRQALESMNRRPRRWAIPAAVVVVAVVALGALALVGNRHHARRVASPVRTVAGSARKSSSPAGIRHPGSVARSHRQAVSPGRTPTTTAPTSLVATNPTAFSGVYSVSSPSYQVTLDATAPCWVDAVDQATGTTLWTGTLPSGGSHVVDGSGPMSVELGATGVTMSVDGIPVVFPSPLRSPFTATFDPVASSSTSTSS